MAPNIDQVTYPAIYLFQAHIGRLLDERTPLPNTYEKEVPKFQARRYALKYEWPQLTLLLEKTEITETVGPLQYSQIVR